MYRIITDVDKVEQPHNPRSYANIFEILTFSWMVNLFKKGQKKELEENDLYGTLDEYKSSSLGNELEKKWKSEVSLAHESNRNPSLLRALIKMFGAKCICCGLLFAIDELILKLCRPLLIGGLLSYLNSDYSNKTNVQYAYIFAFGLLLNILLSTIIYHLTQIENLHCGMKMRVSCCSIIYRKALCLSHAALGETTVGHMINLLSNDVNRFDAALTTCHYLWIGPVQTIIVTYFLWREIGYSSLIGVTTLLIVIPMQVCMGKKVSKFRKETANKTDKRLRLMNELISGIEVIKMYTWEKPLSKLIEYARKQEIRQIGGATFIKAVLLSISQIQSRLQLFICIASYVLLGNYISTQKVYVVTSFIFLLEITMGYFFSIAMEYIAEVLVSIKRIQNFLLLEEKDGLTSKLAKTDVAIIITSDNDTANSYKDIKNSSGYLNDNYSIVFSNVTARWTIDQVINTLDNINLTVRPGTLVAIIGQVGAGKSSLIQAILRELPLREGSISLRGVVSYASQEPWIFGGTIQQNILFDSEMDKDRYEQVVKSCALEKDFEKFPHGDKTTVGERGINLSGGQKARINLARAVYKQADIYLLDDPLSAVDTHVGKHLFDKCINDFLKDKTCLLTTHQIQYLTNVDQIVLMEYAKILVEGSYQELQASTYTKLLGSPKKTTSKDNIDQFNINNNDACSILSPNVSNENILSLENMFEPNEEVENRYSGHVSYSVYASYFSAGGSKCKTALLFLIFFFTQVMITGGDYWIYFWIKHEEYNINSKMNEFKKNDTSTVHDSSDTYLTVTQFRQNCLIIYAGLIIFLIGTWIMRNSILVSVCMRASNNLHNEMFNSIIKTTMNFFKTNSSGRIFNRFSKDMGAIDDILPNILFQYLHIILLLMGIVFVVGFVNIYLMIPTFIIGIICHYIKVFCMPTSRSVKRLEGITRSPVFSHINASIQGITTIRAYGAEVTLVKEFDKYQDVHSSACYLFNTSNEAFGFWLDIVCFIYIGIITFSFLLIDTTYSGNIGLAITQIITLSGMVQWGVRLSTMLENQMISVERVLEYTSCPSEGVHQSHPDKTPPKEWPDSGKIVFQNLYLRYSLDTPQILKNINIRIYPMQKVGIVGRTGAGKSSLITALFRLAFNQGNIFIDDLEIHELGLHDLRSKIAIIPQEPILFSGTVRTNLDPFNEYPDHILWNALEEVELKGVIEDMNDGLNSKMSDGGYNFSAGQRQLICLARAIIRNNKIIVLDEATANVDLKTDELIQNTIRNKFRSCTVLTIAHRLNTIMDSDKVLVMDSGTMVEFDHPYILLKNKNGYFNKMLEKLGRENADFLHGLAKENYNAMKMSLERPTNLFLA